MLNVKGLYHFTNRKKVSYLIELAHTETALCVSLTETTSLQKYWMRKYTCQVIYNAELTAEKKKTIRSITLHLRRFCESKKAYNNDYSVT